MDWDKLRVFHAVAEAGTLTHAGKSLNLSQSAISRQITNLEESLGIILFSRHARGLILTEQGEIMFEATKDIFQRLSMIKGQLQDTRKITEGTIVVTVSEFIGSTWLAPRLVDFREKNPSIQLTVLFDDEILNLSKREADAAIRLTKPVEPNLIQRYLSTIEFHICGAKSYFDKHGTPKTVHDLKNHCLIGFPENVIEPYRSPSWIFDVAHINAKESNNVLKMNSMYAVQKAVATGAGIGVLPDYIITGNKDLEVILPKIECPNVDMYFVYAEERRHSRRIALFRDFILENIEKTRFSIA
jgi:DNA-binding transcriptional LysR family regulator